MKKFIEILTGIIVALNVKQILISLTVILGLIVVPRINFLNFVLPLDDIENILILVFSIFVAYFFIEFIRWLVVKIKLIHDKRSKLKRYSKTLEELINNLPFEQQKILFCLINTNNKPKQINVKSTHESSLIENPYFLYRMPDSNIGRFNYDIYDYKIESNIYPKILELYKKKRIFLHINEWNDSSGEDKNNEQQSNACADRESFFQL